MKIVQINSSLNGSTGMIARDISDYLDTKNIDNRLYYTQGSSNISKYINYSSKKEIKLNALKSRILGNYGFNSNHSTKILINYLEEYNPDIVHIHIVHSHDVNLETLVQYLNVKGKKIIWTMHDCWLYTGYCPYYTYARCDKWKEECHDCKLRKRYSWFLDHSKSNFEKKKNILANKENITFVTPSKWLAEDAKKSFLKENKIEVIPNGIDLNLFKPVETDLKKKLGLEDKKIILSIAMNVSERKGYNDILEVAKILDDEYRIVMVGLPKEIISTLPSNIVGFERTESKEQLVEFYNIASCFLNPTHEDNYPTVNIEAISCGTPVVAYSVGGASEVITKDTGISVKENDIEGLMNAINIICNKDYKESCREYALNHTSKEMMLESYYKLYND